jgi:progesterone-induced-blocking factor 1
MDEEFASIKLDLRMKEDELEHKSLLYDDNLQLLKQSQMEIEMLKSKVDILRSEYYQLESRGRQESSDIRAQNALFKERISNYELIEKELDQAIINVAEGEKQSDMGSVILNTIGFAPTASKRRIQQSLELANRLQLKQNETEKKDNTIKMLTEELSAVKQELDFKRDLSSKTNQPTNYLVSNIEKAEGEVFVLKKELKKKEQEVENLKHENVILNNSKKLLESDFEKLMEKRQNIESLQATLGKLLQFNPSKKLDVQTIKETLAESINENKLHRKNASNPSFYLF